MAYNSFDPSLVYCPDWKKIQPNYKLKKLQLKCPICQAEAASKCGACHRVAYCSNEHQRLHWKQTHRLQCCPFKIVKGDDKVGRYVVAARDLNPGDVIIEESPVTAGPKQFTCPVCLGCYRPVTGEHKCEDCQWPICGVEECKVKNTFHKVSGECLTLSKCVLKPKMQEGKLSEENPIYECLTPMRCLLIRDQVPDNWSVMMAMEQHTAQREKEPFYDVNQTNTVKFLQNHVFKDQVQFGSEEINAVVNVLDVNAFEIRGNDFSIRGVFPLTAMMNSVCNPNTQNCIDEDFTCRVRAATFIPKGQEITTTYTLTLAGTLYRRKHLRESKYFDCCCKRCSDPSECDTHFSTLLCRGCTDS